MRYFTADEEDDYHVAQANAEIDENGYFVNNTVSGRYREETSAFDKSLRVRLVYNTVRCFYKAILIDSCIRSK